MIERLLRIDNPPAHRRRAGAVLFDKPRGKTVGVVVQHVCDIALLPKLDLLGLVPCDFFVTHARKKIAQFLRVGRRKFNKFKAVGASGVLWRDLRFRRAVGERTHGNASLVVRG